MATASRKPYPGRVVLTGGTSGLGKVMLDELLELGSEVLVVSRSADKLKPHSQLYTLELDLTRPDCLQTLQSGCGEWLDTTDCLINNAGFGVFGGLQHQTEDMIEHQVRLMLSVPMQLSRRVLPGMVARGRGHILNISSIAAELPIPFMAGYAAVKAGLSGFSAGLAHELKGSGVRVVDVRPGDLRSAFQAAMIQAGALEGDRAQVWRRMEEEMVRAPQAELMQPLLRKILGETNGPTVVRVGSFFQTRLAPFGSRILPGFIMATLIRRYYGMRK